MCDIINAFAEFLYNNYKFNSKADSIESISLFPEPDDLPETLSEIDISIATNAAQHLCKLLLNVHPGNFQIMLTILQFYEKLHLAETIIPINQLSIVPSGVYHAFLINPNVIILELYTKFLAR